MARKTNPEKETVAPPASVRPRRASMTARPQHSKPAPGISPAPAREPETPAAVLEKPARPDTVAVNRELAHEEIARLAYALWQARGCQHGDPEQDWLQAEQRLKQGA